MSCPDRTMAFQCAGCRRVVDWKTERLVPDPDTAEIKTIGNRFCPSCVGAEAKAHGLSISQMISRRLRQNRRSNPRRGEVAEEIRQWVEHGGFPDDPISAELNAALSAALDPNPPAVTGKWIDLDVDIQPPTRWLRVPGGWLYQTEDRHWIGPSGDREGYWVEGWHAPVFVPDPGAR